MTAPRFLLALTIAIGGWATQATAAEPLHAEIDRLILAGAKGPVAGPASDAEFLRRVWLDFAGSIPPASEVRKFLADTTPDKRTKLIDQLLAGPEYPRRMQDVVTVMLLDRREGKVIPDDAWGGWLRDAFSTNKPWNLLIREMIAADGTEEKVRPGIRFFVDGGRSDPHLLTQDVARIFLGVNWNCARCHDHPSIDDYKQAHYFGLFAFLNPSKVYTDKQSRTFFLEVPTKARTEFVSVFKPDDKRSTGPQLLDGGELEIPQFSKPGEEFETPPKNGHPGIPKFQPRRQLAEQLTARTNRVFARNAVNRFWFQLLGRGLVHPLDLHHSENPPSHPELLEKLTDAFIARDHDVKWLLREIALSATYQRSSVLPEKLTSADLSPDSFRVALPRPLSAEQLARSLAEGLGQRSRLDAVPIPATNTFTYKDYSNGRLPPPENWRDVLALFGALFGHPAGQAEVDFRPSIEQSLFLINDRLIRLWLEPRPDSLTARLEKISDPAALADELYLALFSRLPTAEERADVAAFLRSSDKKSEVIADLCSALIASAEFRLND